MTCVRPETCVNTHNDVECHNWANTDHCDINPGWMHVHCTKACGQCDKDDGSGGQGQTNTNLTESENITMKPAGFSPYFNSNICLLTCNFFFFFLYKNTIFFIRYVYIERHRVTVVTACFRDVLFERHRVTDCGDGVFQRCAI